MGNPIPRPRPAPEPNGPEDRVVPAQKAPGRFKIPRLDGLPDSCAADQFAVDLHRFDLHRFKTEPIAQRGEQRDIAGTSLPKSPIVPDANHAQRTRGSHKRLDEHLRRLSGKRRIKSRLQEILAPQLFDEAQFVRGRCQKMRRRIRSQNSRRVGMKCQDDRRPSQPGRFVHRPPNQCLMAEVHSIKYPDGHAERPGNF